MSNRTPLQIHAADLDSLAEEARSALESNSRKKRDRLLQTLAPALEAAALKAKLLSRSEQINPNAARVTEIVDLDAQAKADIEAHPEAGPNLTGNTGFRTSRAALVFKTEDGQPYAGATVLGADETPEILKRGEDFTPTGEHSFGQADGLIVRDDGKYIHTSDDQP